MNPNFQPSSAEQLHGKYSCGMQCDMLQKECARRAGALAELVKGGVRQALSLAEGSFQIYRSHACVLSWESSEAVG